MPPKQKPKSETGVASGSRPDRASATAEAPHHGKPESRPVEIGGRKDGIEPTRYGDWEKSGRCIDF